MSADQCLAVRDSGAAARAEEGWVNRTLRWCEIATRTADRSGGANRQGARRPRWQVTVASRSQRRGTVTHRGDGTRPPSSFGGHGCAIRVERSGSYTVAMWVVVGRTVGPVRVRWRPATNGAWRVFVVERWLS